MQPAHQDPPYLYPCFGTMDMHIGETDVMEQARALREAEFDFVEAAYESDEAWCEASCKIFRRLKLSRGSALANIVLELRMPQLYPVQGCLEISGVLENASDATIAKAAYEGLPELVNSCKQLALALEGSEAVLSVLQYADEWVSDHWPTILSNMEQLSQATHTTQDTLAVVPSPVFGRRLIYSHHIIAKGKRRDLQTLASQHKLTGFVRIGWPGIIIIEGLEEDCQAFYDAIRRWSWQYLVVRGEMQEPMGPDNTVDEYRRFTHGFREEDDMSVVATACRNVGLEALFKTSMKVYAEDSKQASTKEEDDDAYGTLVRVDHMSDGKTYRKWLRRMANEIDLLLMIKQCHPSGDLTKRPFIFVGMVGQKKDVSALLERWSLDSKGKPCLESIMTILFEGYLQRSVSSKVDSEATHSEENVVQSVDKILELSFLIGGEAWKGAIVNSLRYVAA